MYGKRLLLTQISLETKLYQYNSLKRPPSTYFLNFEGSFHFYYIPLPKISVFPFWRGVFSRGGFLANSSDLTIRCSCWVQPIHHCISWKDLFNNLKNEKFIIQSVTLLKILSKYYVIREEGQSKIWNHWWRTEVPSVFHKETWTTGPWVRGRRGSKIWDL